MRPGRDHTHAESLDMYPTCESEDEGEGEGGGEGGGDGCVHGKG